MKLYITGKITGDQNYQGKFKKVQKYFEKMQQTVLNPASLPERMAPADYMRICFSMIDCADVVVFLPDWCQSEGAKLEYQYCKYIGKEIAMFDEMEMKAQKGSDWKC